MMQQQQLPSYDWKTIRLLGAPEETNELPSERHVGHSSLFGSHCKYQQPPDCFPLETA